MNANIAKCEFVIDEIPCWFLQTILGHFCGYAKFTRAQTLSGGYDGLLTYVPVHGGITYARQCSDGFVYGFDCAHYNSPTVPSRDWLIEQCRTMVIGIKLASKLEPVYLSASREERAELIDTMQRDVELETGTAVDKFNFGVCINLLSGNI